MFVLCVEIDIPHLDFILKSLPFFEKYDRIKSMNGNLSYVLITPYTVAKSRTGGIIGRLLLQSQLDLVGAQMFIPDEAFVRDYAALLRKEALPDTVSFLADYVEESFMKPYVGKAARALLFLFRGEDACEKLANICGHIYSEHRNLEDVGGETSRDTYSDLILSPHNPEKYIYFEPAVITPRNDNEAMESMALFARHLEGKPNLVEPVIGKKEERTLVILKPDNWRIPSARPGSIIDMFSHAGLSIAGMKIHRFSLNQALEFYHDVLTVLSRKLAPTFAKKGEELLERAYGLTLSEATEKALEQSFGMEYAHDQFEQIVEFMSGWRSNTCPPGAEDDPGTVKCMIIIYEGENAVEKIRSILGPPDPNKAPAGTVRREFGSNVMVNTAHASDSIASYERESKIIRVGENTLVSIIRKG
jgi:nucleoside diphosphate kinase